MSRLLWGSLLVLAAGVSWGISGVSGQYLMANGVSVTELTTVRLLASGIVLMILAFIRHPQQVREAYTDKNFLIPTFWFSIFGLAANQFAYLQAIHHTNAGTATVLQYLTPILVLLYVCMRERRSPSVVEIVAVILAIAGTFVMATHGQVGSLAISPIGFTWGIISAFTYALYIILPMKPIAQYGSLITIGTAMVISGVLALLITRSLALPGITRPDMLLAYFGIIGIGTIFAYTIFLKGTTMVGAVRGSLLASVEPVASVILTVIVMGVQFYAMDVVGMIAIMGAVLLISLKDMRGEAKKKAFAGRKR